MSVSRATGTRTGISLRQILPQATFLNADDVTIQSCAGRLGECQSQDLFVALVDAEHDGHEDAELALRKGASAVLTERLLPIASPQCIVSDSRVAYGQICHALAGDPSRRLVTVGVSGTDGKTTTAHLVQSILEADGVESGLHSSLHNTNGNLPNHNSATPPALAEQVASMVIDGKRAAVVETSSVSLARRAFSGMQLDVAVLTNLRGGDFEYHNSLANYHQAEWRLLDYLKPQGVAILNADDPSTHFRLGNIDRPALTFGLRQQADITARILESDLYEQTFLMSAGEQSIPVRTRIPGRHHVYNCLAAAATAVLQGIDLTTIARGLEQVQELPGRMNLLKCGQSFAVAVDEAASPYRLGVALHTLRRHVKGRVICLVGATHDISPERASQFGRIVERNCDVPVITTPRVAGNRARQTVNYEPFHRVLDGFRKPKTAKLMPDRLKAIEWALSEARPGDAVLIAGQGHRPIASLGDGRWSLTDAEVCQSWLYGESTAGDCVPVSHPVSSIFHIDDFRPC